jgi:hypothetical protein
MPNKWHICKEGKAGNEKRQLLVFPEPPSLPSAGSPPFDTSCHTAHLINNRGRMESVVMTPWCLKQPQSRSAARTPTPTMQQWKASDASLLTETYRSDWLGPRCLVGGQYLEFHTYNSQGNSFYMYLMSVSTLLALERPHSYYRDLQTDIRAKPVTYAIFGFLGPYKHYTCHNSVVSRNRLTTKWSLESKLLRYTFYSFHFFGCFIFFN